MDSNEEDRSLVKKLLLMHKKTHKYFLVDKDKDFHSQFGVIKKDVLKDVKPGSIIKTHMNKEFYVIDPMFVDLYNKIKRRAQIIPKKDIGIILSNTLVGKDDVCLEAGSGSGALTIALAKYCKKVYSFDIREDHQNVAKENVKSLGLENVEFIQGSIYDKDFVLSKIKENLMNESIKLFVLDVPEPWLAIETADSVLSIGGFLVVYTPTIIQNADFVNELSKHESFIHIKTINVMEQEWEIKGRVIRPKSYSIYHSGFISFARKVK